MSLCANVDSFNVEVEDFIEQYENIIKNESLSPVDESDYKEALDRLYSYKDAITDENLEYVNAQGKDAEKAEIKEELLKETFERIIGKYFPFSKTTNEENGNALESESFNEASEPLVSGSIGTLVSIKPSGNKLKLVYTEKGVEKSNVFSMNSSDTSTDNGSTSITLPGFTKFAGEYLAALEQKENDEIVLGSKGTKVKLGEKFKDNDYSHGDSDQMKGMLKRLHILGGNKAKDEDLDTYLDLIDRMTPNFFNDLDLYLNEAGNNSEGVARAKRIDIVINPKAKEIGNQQSEASMYIEEVIHSMTSSAMHAKALKANKLKRQLANLIEQARKQISWKDFLPPEAESINSDKEVAYAKWLYDYILVDKNADYEFLAKGLAVPEVSRAFAKIKVKDKSGSRSILVRINEFFGTIIDLLSGSITLAQANETVHDAVVNLAYSFGEINNKAERKLQEQDSMMDKAIGVVNSMDENINLFSSKTKDKVFGELSKVKLPHEGSSLYERSKNEEPM